MKAPLLILIAALVSFLAAMLFSGCATTQPNDSITITIPTPQVEYVK